MTQATGPERIEVEVLLADLLRDYNYLQIIDQLLAAGGDVDEETSKILRRVGIAAGMLRRSCTDLVVHVTGARLAPSVPS